MRLSILRSTQSRWAGVVTDAGGVFVERFCGPAHARWTVRIGERGAVVIEPESYLDGPRSDFPLRSVHAFRVVHESRQRHVVVFDRGHEQVRLVCRDPEVADRIAARGRALHAAAAPSPASPPRPTAAQWLDGRRRSPGTP